MNTLKRKLSELFKEKLRLKQDHLRRRAREWERRNADTALCETGRQLKPQISQSSEPVD